MSSANRIPHAGAYQRHFTHYEGIFFDEFRHDSAWLRDKASIHFPPLADTLDIVINGECVPHPDTDGIDAQFPTLICQLAGQTPLSPSPKKAGHFQIRVAIPASENRSGTLLQFELHGVAQTNFLAWMGRLTNSTFLQRFRAQNKNRQLRLTSIETSEGDTIFDFSNRTAPYSGSFARRHTKLGLNIAGFLTADLGIGESARCMVRAADAAKLETALVPLKLHCKNRLGDDTYTLRLENENPHKFNVVHLDPPASRDLDHHHGKAFREGKYNIGYWAWELPEFPDAWVPSCLYFDEIWCPSDFAREAIAMKVSLPVIAMPHAISFKRPTGDVRQRFGLPSDRFLFLVLYDLNSYSERKNPSAAINAFRLSALAEKGAALVLKVHNVSGNEKDLQTLRADIADLPGSVIITDTLSRADVYALEAACDSYVSLHRSEGFGLAIAECMYLGKPVISTDWSATAEFVDTTNGCPVNYSLKTLERSFGPYGKGQTWAEADPEHAAEWMRKLHGDSSLVEQLGNQARETIESRYSPEVIGARYRKRLENITMW